jgi:uncharacterized protein YdaU (DUF1376 family)
VNRQSPAFQFYPADFVSGAPAFMKPLETHVYIWLLCLDWNHGGFEFHAEDLASWCRMSVDEFTRAWRKVGESFVERDGRYFNPRLDAEREKQREYSERMSENGKKGGRPKAVGKPRVSRGKADVKPNESISISTSTTNTTSTKASAAGADGPADSWPARLAGVWTADVGDVKPGRIGAALKPAVDRHGVERVERAMRAYIAVQKGDGKPCKVAWFAEQSQVWVERTATPLGIVDGEMSDTLELLTRPSRGAA